MAYHEQKSKDRKYRAALHQRAITVPEVLEPNLSPARGAVAPVPARHAR